MKKLILLFLLFYSFAYSQVDTANYNFNVDLLTGKYTSIISKSPVFGAQGFKYLVQELQATSIDTTLFQYVGNIDGKYTMIENVVSYYGKDSGLVRMMLYDNPNDTLFSPSSNNTFTGNQTFDTLTAETVLPTTADQSTIGGSSSQFLNVYSKFFYENGNELSTIYAKLGSQNTFTNALNIFSGKIKIGTGTSTTTADLLTIGDTIKFRGALTQDSSYLRLLWGTTGRLKMELISRTGGNMMTWDSTLVSTASDFRTNGDFITVSQKGNVIGFNSSGTQGVYLNSTADNFLRIRNAGVSTDATVQMGSLIISTVTPIATASTTGTQGQIRVGSDGYIYICTATNTWVRVQGLTW